MEKFKKYVSTPFPVNVEAIRFDGSVPPLAEGEEPGLFRLSDDGAFVQTPAGPLFIKEGEYLVIAEDGSKSVYSRTAFVAAYNLVEGQPDNEAPALDLEPEVVQPREVKEGETLESVPAPEGLTETAIDAPAPEAPAT